jgi:hypothetical protein
MKIVRSHFETAVGQRRQARCFDMDHIVLILERPFYKQKFTARYNEPVPIIAVGRHDELDHTCLDMRRSFRLDFPLSPSQAL